MFRTKKTLLTILFSGILGAGVFATEYIVNGGFETGDFTGWEMINQGGGYWAVHDSQFVNYWLEEVVPPISGNFSAITEQYEPSLEFIFQVVITIPNNVFAAEISWFDRIINLADDYLDTTNFNFDQNFYVLLGIGEEIIPLYVTVPGDSLMQYGPNYRNFDVTSLFSAHTGKSATIFFLVGAVEDPLIVQVDDISIDIETSIPVVIDIKPYDANNTFNNNGSGVIPIAILGSATFDATEIDVETVSLEGLAVKAVGKSNKLLFHYEDVNGDGYDDLWCQIEDSDQVFEEGATTATVTGNLNNGAAFHGEDSITIVP